MNPRFCFLPAAIIALLIVANDARGQVLYSYLDKDGVRVFTNMAPVDQSIEGVQIIGADPSAVLSGSGTSSESYDSIIERYAKDYRLDPALIRSIIETESGYNAKAISPKGARGLMQLMPATAKRLGVEDSFDPEQNIRGGVKHFRSLLDTFDNDLVLSLAAYNAGENLVQRLGCVPAIKETRDYVRSVTSKYEKSRVEQQQVDSYSPIRPFYDESGVLNITNIPPKSLSEK